MKKYTLEKTDFDDLAVLATLLIALWTTVLSIWFLSGITLNVKEQPVKMNFLERGEPLSIEQYTEQAAKDFFLVDINTAGYDELISIPGIGDTRAKAIIEHRRENGPFKNKRDLMDVKGIDLKLYAEIRDEIRV